MDDEPTYKTEDERKKVLQDYFQAKQEISERYRTKVRTRITKRLEERLTHRYPYSVM